MSYHTEANGLVLSRENLPKIRVLIVDNQELNCKLLEVILDSEPDLEIVGTAEDGREALAQIEVLQPDIVLMDIEMPEMDGITTTEIICQRFPEIKVIIITSHQQQEYINRALRAGARGFLLKDTPSQELVNAIRFVHQDYLQFGPGLFKQVDEQESNGDRDRVTSTDIVLSPTRLPSTTTQNDWSDATKELLDTLPRVWTRGLLYFLVVFIGIALPWTIFSQVDETGTARGRLEPTGKTIKLDAPVAGTVAAIKVKEGDLVKAGQRLLELESELVSVELQQQQRKLEGQQNRLHQLEFLKNQLLLALRTQEQQNQAQQLEKQAQVEQARQNLDSLRAAYSLQKEEKSAQVEQARQAIESSQAASELVKISLEAAREKIPRYKQAYEQGALSQERFLEVQQSAKEAEKNLIKAESEIRQTQSHLKEQQGSYEKIIHQASSEIQQAQLRLQEQERGYKSLVHSGKLAVLKSEEQLNNLETQITTLDAEISESKSQIKSLEFQLSQRMLAAPIEGIIFQSPIKSAGAVVQPGDNLVEIAPQGSSLLLRAQIATTESGSLRREMPVKMKFDAYPFQDYGVVKGKVTDISPTSKITETDQGKVATYDLEIQLDKNCIPTPKECIALRPGDTATAEVIVRQRRIIDLILDPFKKLQQGGLKL